MYNGLSKFWLDCIWITRKSIDRIFMTVHLERTGGVWSCDGRSEEQTTQHLLRERRDLLCLLEPKPKLFLGRPNRHWREKTDHQKDLYSRRNIPTRSRSNRVVMYYFFQKGMCVLLLQKPEIPLHRVQNSSRVISISRNKDHEYHLCFNDHLLLIDSAVHPVQ